ncbi:MAG: putative DNA binding domain-containing protein [Bacteroidales bacterium]|nr:putative DNA binding domain-containing protein [Bacteroidales bacterium]
MQYDYNDMQIYVAELMRDRESTEVEFKSAKGGFPKSFWETYSAFANTHGGVIVLGVKEKDDTYTLNHLTNEEVDKLQKDFWSNVHNKNTINSCLLKSSDVQVAEIEDAKVILFYIPQAQREQRPIHCTLNAFNGTFRRNHEGDYLCSNAEVRRMFADADITRPADSRILKNYSWDDIDMPSFEQYRRLFATARPSHPWHTLSDEALMRKLGGYRKDRETGEEGFTQAGLLMFGKYDSIIDQSCAPHFFPDYKEIPDDTSITRWLDRICPDGTWEANLFQFYRRVLPKLQQVIPTPFQLEGNQRRDETPAHESIREAFANLCVHADYSEESSLLVNRYAHRIVFSNPGTMLISRQQYYQGGESICRNKSLQQMFMMIGSAEKAGSGVDKILKGWETLNWKRPYPIEKAQPNKVELIMPLESLLDEKVLSELCHIFGDKIKKREQSDIMALSLALTENVINNERIREVLAMHPADVTHLLQRLCKEDLLISFGHGRGTVYSLKDATLQDKGASSNPKDATLQNKDASSDTRGATLLDKGASLDPKGATSQNKGATSISSRMSKKELRKAILAYCSEWRTAAEIALYLGKTKPYIRNKVLPQMSDVLQMLFTKENHPGQKYKVKGE